MSSFRRGYVDLPDRQVHYRYGGRGPAIVLLHQSPQSSRAMLPIAADLADAFTVIMPDTPGFGHSDPLAQAEPGIADLSLALHEVVQALGLERFALFGQHTGGLIGLDYASRYPERVAGLVIDGLAAFNEAESAFILASYLTPFLPAWDGSHLTWLWARLREQLIFFPWHDRRAAARMGFAIPPPAALHSGVIDFLEAGDHYRAGYGAAFRYHEADRTAGLQMPAAILFREDDPLAPHAGRLPALPDRVQVEQLPADRALMHARVVDALRRFGAAASDQWQPAAPRPATERPLRRFVTAGERQVSLLESGDDGPLTLLVPDTARAGHHLAGLARAMHGRHVIVPDLPGCGETALAHGDERSPAGAGACLLQQLPMLRETPFALVGFGGGSQVATAMAQAAPDHVRCLLLAGAWRLPADAAAVLAERYAEPIEADAYGNHLQRLWQQLRDARLFFPWYEANPAHARGGEPDLDPAGLQAEFTDALKAGEHWPGLWRDRFEAAALREAQALPPGTRLAMFGNEAAPAAGRAFAKLHDLAAPTMLPRGDAALAAALTGLLSED